MKPEKIFVVWQDYDFGGCEEFNTPNEAKVKYLELCELSRLNSNGTTGIKVIRGKEFDIIATEVIKSVDFI
jgi:hypothetical protein